MNNVVFEMIEKNKKNSRLSSADKETLENALLDVLSKENYNDQIEKVLCEGPAESTMKALALYLTSIEIGDADTYLKKFICCDRIQENRGGAAGTRLVFLVTSLMNCVKEQNRLVEVAFTTMVWSAYKKENDGLNKKVVVQIRNSFFPLFDSKDSVLDLYFIEKDKVWIRTRDLFIDTMINIDKTSFERIQKVYYWLKSSGRNMGKYTEEYIAKITLEQTEKEKDDLIHINQEKNVSTTQQSKKETSDYVEDQKENSIDQVEKESVNEKKHESVLNEHNKNEKKQNESEVLVKLIALSLAEFENQKAVSMEITSLKKKINDMQLQINKLLGEEEQQQKYIQELVSEKRELKDANVFGERKIKELTELAEKLKSEIDDRKQFTDTVTRNREKQSEEQLNKLASKLRVDYRDFCDAKEIDMTIDLGENMREQLGAVFSILEKSGIKLS